jgi:hypothetical protein
MTDPKDAEVSLIESPSSEGIDSLETVLVDITDSKPPSLSFVSSSSSGGLKRKSKGLFSKDIEVSFSSTATCCSIASTVNLWPAPARYRLRLLDFGGGIEVRASNAATEGDISS